MNTASRLVAASLAPMLAAMVIPGSAFAQADAPSRADRIAPRPAVTVSATAATKVANDRVHAWLRAEADEATAAAAAAAVNARMARALSRARGAAAVTTATSGYSTQQIAEKGKPLRWRVTQTLSLESARFRRADDAGLRAAAGRRVAAVGDVVLGQRRGAARRPRTR